MPHNTRADARRLFPAWSRKQQAKWVVAKLRSERCHPAFGKLLPLTVDAIVRPHSMFAPRTLREAA